jgi:hypothetical protein
MRSELGKKSSDEQIGELGIGGGQIVLGALLYSFLAGSPPGQQVSEQRGTAIRRTGPTTDGTGWVRRGLALEPPGVRARGSWMGLSTWTRAHRPLCWAENRADEAFFFLCWAKFAEY